MTNDGLLLGIDVGTSGAKALLMDTGGGVRATVTTPYELSTPRPLWAEQAPEDWWAATCASIRGVLTRANVPGAAITAIGLTGQMHGLVLLDAAGVVLRPAILWNDQRTAAECRLVHERVGLERTVRLTGKPALTGFTAPKILWVREHEPEVYAATAHVLLPKDFVRYRLTGVAASDAADASGTSLFDVSRRRWSDEIIDALEIPRAWLPEVAESPVVTATVSAAGAAASGLDAGTPVVAGAGDQAAEAVGCGIVADGAVSVTVGTSGVVFASMNDATPDQSGRLHGFCHALPARWHVMGVMLSAGGSLRWYRDTIAAGGDDYDYDTLVAEATRVPAGAEGLLFLPYLAGERTPHADPEARGAFVGLTLRHGRAHLTRAVLEGVTFGLREGLELVRERGAPIERLRVSGGGARSAAWRQMMADVFGATVATVNVSEGAAYGAALLAAVGAGAYADVETAVRAVVRETTVVEPGPEADRYVAVFERYRALYPALADDLHALGRLAGGA